MIKQESHDMENYKYGLKKGIAPSKEFAKKGLAEFAVNVGVRCGHDCTYCSSRATLRMHPAFKKIGKDPFKTGYSIVDPDIVQKVAKDAASRQSRGLVELCTTVDAWAPEAQELNLGRGCLEALLAEPEWEVRILTTNAAVSNDFDVVKKYRDRVAVGLSLTGTIHKQKVLSVIEPYASPSLIAWQRCGKPINGPENFRHVMSLVARYRRFPSADRSVSTICCTVWS